MSDKSWFSAWELFIGGFCIVVLILMLIPALIANSRKNEELEAEQAAADLRPSSMVDLYPHGKEE
jgi:hypothetical protein